MTHRHPLVWPVLVLAVVAVSSAAVLVRLAPGVHPVAVALWRCAIVGVLLAPTMWPALRRGGLAVDGPLSRRDIGLVALAGGLLAMHFVSWFASLAHTSVLRSTLLVCLSPVWTALIEWAARGERPSPWYWPGVGLALVGVGVMAQGAGAAEASSWLGDGLATLGGVLAAAYLVVGRTARQRVGIGPYGALICLSASLWLLPAVWWTEAPLTGFPPSTWLALVGLALGPQLFGHIGFNFAVRYVPAAVVASLVLLEPLGAAVLAAVVLDELPGRWDVVGGVVVLLGLGTSLRRPRAAVGAQSS